MLNAHSLYLETLAETGLVGLGLLVGFLATLAIAGIIAVRRASAVNRPALATALAGYLAFLVTAAYDWVWQIPAITLVALLLGAALVGARRGTDAGGPPSDGGGERAGAGAGVGAGNRRGFAPGRSSRGLRLGLAAVSVVGLVAVALPYSEAVALRASQAQAGAHRTRAALAAADTAAALEPFAPGPPLQRALLLEAAGDLPAARVAVLQAVRRAPSDWQPWFIAARVSDELGDTRAAVSFYEHARRLDPLFLRARL